MRCLHCAGTTLDRRGRSGACGSCAGTGLARPDWRPSRGFICEWRAPRIQPKSEFLLMLEQRQAAGPAESEAGLLAECERAVRAGTLSRGVVVELFGERPRSPSKGGA